MRALAQNFEILVPTCVDAKQKQMHLRQSIHDINFVDASVDVDMLSVSWGLRTADEFAELVGIFGAASHQQDRSQCAVVMHKMCVKRGTFLR